MQNIEREYYESSLLINDPINYKLDLKNYVVCVDKSSLSMNYISKNFIKTLWVIFIINKIINDSINYKVIIDSTNYKIINDSIIYKLINHYINYSIHNNGYVRTAKMTRIKWSSTIWKIQIFYFFLVPASWQ